MKKTGVYEIRCTVNGKVYVGSAAFSFRHRWKYHQLHLRRGDHDNGYLQAAWAKHGEESFEFLVLEECTPEQCIVREQFWIDAKDASNRNTGFNLAPRAGSSLGFRHTEEAKAKVVAFLTGRKPSEETRAKMRAAHANPSPEYRAKRSEALRLGRKWQSLSVARSSASNIEPTSARRVVAGNILPKPKPKYRVQPKEGRKAQRPEQKCQLP